MATAESNENNKQERRQYDRLVKSGSISYWLASGGQPADTVCQGTILDLGAGGVRFLVDRQIAKNSLLGMSLEFFGWRLEEETLIATGDRSDVSVMEVLGYVMWQTPSEGETDKYETGVRFSNRLVKE